MVFRGVLTKMCSERYGQDPGGHYENTPNVLQKANALTYPNYLAF